MIIRPLTPQDAPAYVVIRREGLEQEPFSFASSPEDDRSRSVEWVQARLGERNQAIIGAFGPGLVGVVGVFREETVKARHKAHIWGMFVRAEGRGKGLGRKLMEAALDWARNQDGVSHVHLVTSPRTPVAKALYQSLGFQTWGVEPDALCVNGELVSDEHMVLVLTPNE